MQPEGYGRLQSHPKDQCPILLKASLQEVCCLKCDELGKPICYKVCWVAKGFQQIWGRDFTDTTLPTTHLESLCAILHIAAYNDWRIDQYNVKITFLNGILPDNEAQFMEQPPGFVAPGQEDCVWKLSHGLYGMQQSFCIWNKTLNTAFLGWDFQCADCEWCIYTRHSMTTTSAIAIHMDDMLVVSSNDTEAVCFHSELELTWQITALGEPKMVLGIAIQHDRKNHTIYLNQTTLIDKICAMYNQLDAKTAPTPIAHGAFQPFAPSSLQLNAPACP